MAEKIRWGIMGTGRIAHTFVRSLARSEFAEKYAVASRSNDRAQQFAGKNDIPRFFGNYSSLLTDKNIDAIYVATPHTIHRQCVLSAIASKKHVLCEKPMGVTPMECKEMIALAERQKVVLLEAFMYRVHPQTLKLQELLAAERIGTIRTIRSAFTYGLGPTYNVRLDRDLRGGGLYDVGCYCVNFSRMVAGEEPGKVEAMWMFGEESKVDENLVCSMEFPSGALAVFDVGVRSVGNSYAEILGTKGRIIIPNPWKPDPRRASIHVFAVDQNEEVVIENGGEVYALEADHMAKVIAGEEEPLITAEDALNNSIVLDTLWRRMHSGDAAPAAV